MKRGGFHRNSHLTWQNLFETQFCVTALLSSCYLLRRICLHTCICNSTKNNVRPRLYNLQPRLPSLRREKGRNNPREVQSYSFDVKNVVHPSGPQEF